MWPKFANPSISMREVVINLIFIRIWPDKPLFLRFGLDSSLNNLGLALGMSWKFYTSEAKG